MWFGFIAISVIIIDVVFEFITMSIIVFVPAKRILNEWHTIISNKSIGSNCV